MTSSRSLFATTLALASSSRLRLRLRAPKTWSSRPLTATAPSNVLNDKPQSQSRSSSTRPKGQPPPPPPPPPPTRSAHHLSAATHSTRGSRHTADKSSSTLRQQQQQYYSESSSQTQTSPSSPSSPEKRPLLQPYELSRRLIALCEQGDVDLAVSALQQAARNAQNIKVWNTIIQQCMSAKKYKLAYSVFTDMKRRGFMPNVRTYATMMSGYATVDDWKPLTTQLGLVHSLYGQLRQHLERSRNFIDDDPAGESSASFILYPIALYISILGKAGQFQKAFDVFHELDTSGPLAPHPKIYSSLLSALAERVDAPDVDAKVIAQSVSEAKYVWRRHMRSFDSQPRHDVEPRSIEAMIKLLSRGNPPDHELMFDIVRDICGLPRPGDGRPPSPPSQKKNVAPTVWILNEILDGCDAAGRPEMAVHYAQSVMDTRELRPILRARHLYKLLRAHILLAKKGSTLPSRSENVAAWVEWMVAQDPARKSEKTIPNERTIVSALELCHHCKDIQSALRIARAMTSDGSQGSHGSTGSLTLPVKAWERLFHLASVTGADAAASQDEMRRCFKILTRESCGGSKIFDVWGSTSAIERLEPREKRALVPLARHIVRVFKTGLPALVHEEGAEEPHAADLEATRSDILKRAELFLEKTQKYNS